MLSVMKMMHLDVSGVAGLQFDMGEPTPDNIVLCCHRQDYYACQLCRNIDIEERLSAIKQTFQQYVTTLLLNLDIIYSIKEKTYFSPKEEILSAEVVHKNKVKLDYHNSAKKV